MCRGSASGWRGLILISWSFREPSRAQSVSDALEVDFLLTSRCLSHGDHLDVIVLLGVHQGDYVATEKPQGHESLLSIVETVVFIRVRDALEHFFGITEIQSVFLEIQAPLSLIPSNHGRVYIRIVYASKRKCFKG
jgi:hypothetical protein